MAIRESTAEDVEAIARVARASWEADYPDILSRETAAEGVEAWYAPEQLEREIESENALVPVVEIEAEIVGFAHAVTDEQGGTILRLYVAPEHRRDGVGGDLLEHTRSALAERGAERVRAMVFADNDLGNEFYRRFGFEPERESETEIGGETYRETVYVADA